MLITSVFVFNIIIESGVDGPSTALKVGTMGTRGKGRNGTMNGEIHIHVCVSNIYVLITFVFVFNVIIENGIDSASTALNVGTVGTRGNGRNVTVNGEIHIHVCVACILLITSVFVFNIIIESGVDGPSTALKVGTMRTRGKGRNVTLNGEIHIHICVSNIYVLITFVFVFNVIIENGIDGANTALNVRTIGTRGNGRNVTVNGEIHIRVCVACICVNNFCLCI